MTVEKAQSDFIWGTHKTECAYFESSLRASSFGRSDTVGGRRPPLATAPGARAGIEHARAHVALPTQGYAAVFAFVCACTIGTWRGSGGGCCCGAAGKSCTGF